MMYGSMEYRKKRDIYLRGWLLSKSQVIDNIPDNHFKALCYFSLIENFAQEYSKYPTNGTTRAFCTFVIQFQTSYSFLDKYDPVTLFNYFMTELKESFNLSFLDHGVNYNPDQAVRYGRAMEMIKHLESLGIKKSQYEKHKFVCLLYSCRSKLSHELFSSNNMLCSDLHLLPEYPYYLSSSRSYESNGERVIDDYNQLVFPVGFIKKLALECINNYLDYCIENKDDPFDNNSLDRKSVIAWYD